MHDITPMEEQVLRDHGFSDEQIDELRRIGRLQEETPAGAMMFVDLAELHVDEGTATFPPEVLERLRRFAPSLPKATRDQIELASGQDIDGDGRIAGGDLAAVAAAADAGTATPVTGAWQGGATANAHADDAEQTTHGLRASGASGAMPSRDAGGPFVGASRTRPWWPSLIGLAAGAAVAWWYFS